MYKLARIVRFGPGMERAEGKRRWRGRHAELGRAVHGVERYVQNHATESLGLVGPDAERPDFDGYACVWFADRDAFQGALGSPEWDAMVADDVELFDTAALATMVAAVEEHTIIDGPEGPFKAVWVVRFKDDIRADPARTGEAHAYWTATHGGAYGVKVPGIDRYVQNHVVEPLDDGVQPAFDGFSECWFQDRAAFDVTMASTEWGEMNADAETIFDVGWIVGGMSALIDEVVVKG